jgi:uncharacterized protein YdaU (DUF1376 family)
MSVRVEVEEMETTKSEKLLAVVLALFLLIGGIWAYQRIDDEVREAVGTAAATADEQAAIARHERARTQLIRATRTRDDALRQLELSREAYRTALDADRRDAALERDYRSAQAAHEQAVAAVRRADGEARAAAPAADAARRRIGDASGERQERRALIAFALRLAFVLGAIALAYWLVGRLRRAGSRWFPLALAAVGFAAVLAFVMAVDYVTDYVDPLDLGPLVLSLFGIAATLIAFAVLQRYLVRRLPRRRVRRRECPFCGYPAREGSHCEGCGREVAAACATCGESRRVGAAHCVACGAA